MGKETVIGVGQYVVASNPAVFVCLGLGSCVGIVLYDSNGRKGGMAHAMLPYYEEGRDKSNPGKYVDTAIYLMVDELKEMTVRKSSLKAKLVGGSQMFSFIKSPQMDIGSRNVKAAIEVLRSEGIPVVAKDVGGAYGRTVTFDLRTGVMEVKKAGDKNLEI